MCVYYKYEKKKYRYNNYSTKKRDRIYKCKTVIK